MAYYPKERSIVVLFVVYFIIISFLGLRMYRQPTCNWDMMPYMAVIYSYDGLKENVHAKIYDAAKKEVSSNVFNQLTDSSVATKYNAYKNPQDFYAQMPFYVVKPLYTFTSYLFYKVGIPITKSTVLPSILSYLGIAVILFFWMATYKGAYFAFVVSWLIMLLPPLQATAMLSTPDMLTTFLIFLGLYLVIEKSKLHIGLLFLFLSIFARLDNVIFCGLFIIMLQFGYYQNHKPALKKTAFLLLLCVVCYLLVSAFAMAYGWGILYYTSFAQHMNDENNFNKAFSIASYLKLIKKQLMYRLGSSYLPVFLLFMIVMLNKYSVSIKQKLMPMQAMMLLSIVVIVARFILQPTISDRFFIIFYLITFMFIIKDFLIHKTHKV